MVSETSLATQVEDSSLNLRLRMQITLSDACLLSQKQLPLEGHPNPSNYSTFNTISLHQDPPSIPLTSNAAWIFTVGSLGYPLWICQVSGDEFKYMILDNLSMIMPFGVHGL